MATDLAKLVVRLEASTAQYSRELEKARTQLGSFHTYVKSSVSSIATAFAGAFSIGAAFQITKAALDGADALNDMAEQVGLSVSKLSELQYAAVQNGLSAEEMGKAIFHLNEQMANAAAKGGDLAAAFKKFGISQKDIASGTVTTEEAIKRIADKFNAMPNGVDKARLAAEIFGTKLGQKIIPLLNGGAKGLEELAKQGRAAGAVLDDETAKALAHANDQLDAFSRLLSTRVQVGLAAMLEKLGLIQGDQVAKDVKEITDQIADLNDQITQLQTKEDQTGIQRIWGAITGDDFGVPEKLKKMLQDLKDLEDARAKLITRQAQPKPKTGGGGVDTSAADQAAMKKQLDEFNKDLIRAAEDYDKTLQSVIDKYDTAGAKARQFTEDQILLQRAAALGNQAAIDALNKMAEGYGEVEDDAKDTATAMSKFWEEAAKNMQDSFANFLFDPFKDGLSGMLSGFAETLRRMAAQAAAAAIFQKLLGPGGVAGDWFKDTFGAAAASVFGGPAPAKAAGGMVSAGAPYWVGERGPEFFVPNVSGAVMPTHESPAGGSVVFNITTPNADSFRASERQLMRSARRGLGI